MSALRDGWPDMIGLFMSGQCLTLHRMLRAIWPDAKAMYSRVEGHVYTLIRGRFYDIRGRHLKLPPDIAPLDWSEGDPPHRWVARDTRRLSDGGGVTVQEAARVLLDRLQYSAEAGFLDAMQQVMPTEQTADLYAGLTAALSALEGK